MVNQIVKPTTNTTSRMLPTTATTMVADQDPIANVSSVTRVARAAHIFGLAKGLKKRRHGLWNSNSEKIESLLCFIDRVETIFVLAEDFKQHLSSIANAGNSNSTLTSRGIAIEVLHIVTSHGR